jgi:hypothetical protein
VFPIAALPDSPFAFRDLAGGSIGIDGQGARELAFDEAPTQRKVGVVRRERPDRVHVIGKNADRDGFERIEMSCRVVCGAQEIDAPHQQIA